MLRAVDLDQLAKILPPRSGLLNRLATCSSRVPEAGIAHQSAQRLAAD
jgi:hypothetical protein